MSQRANWQTWEPVPLSAQAVHSLIAGQLPAVEIPGFADDQETAELSAALYDMQARSQSIRQVLRVGISQYQEGVKGSKQEYFRRAAELLNQQQAVFARSFDPLQRIMQQLRAVEFDVDVMVEPGFGRYYAGVGKSRRGTSPIHVDFAPQDSRDWEVGQAAAQLSWNFYLNTPQGGRLVIWDRFWEPADDVHQVTDNYYYSNRVVAGARHIELNVAANNVLLLNSRNYHAITETPDRLAFGSFISYFPTNRLRLWS